MKIVHISTYDYGGAGLATLRLHKSLLTEGVDSKVLVAHKSSDDNNIFEVEESNINKFIPPKNRFFRYAKIIMRKFGFGIPQLERYRKDLSLFQKEKNCSIPFSFPISSYDLAEHPLVKAADIIHLHWIGDFVDFDTFFKKVEKPIVWTIHDMNPLMGGFHHVRLKNKYYCKLKKIEDSCYSIKKNSLSKCNNISIVAISSQMEKNISEHEFFKDKPVYKIFNSVDGDVFKIQDRNTVRKSLDIPSNKIILLFVNVNLGDSEKGLKELILALEESELNNIELLCVGDGLIPKETIIPIIRFHSVKDTKLLSLLYSVADYYIHPSFQEALPQTPLEALCCGIPTIITPVSGSDDIINDFNGTCCNGFSIQDICNGINNTIGKEFNSFKIREDIMNRFNPHRIALQYLQLYERMMN